MSIFNFSKSPVTLHEEQNLVSNLIQQAPSNSSFLKINLRRFGYEKAGASMGNINVLKNMLSDILNGYYVDQSENEEEQNKIKAEKQNEIEELEKQLQAKENEIKMIKEVSIPSFKDKIQKLEKAIEEIKISATKKADDILSRFNLGIYWPVFIMATVFLYGFYLSAFHSAFFKNIQEAVSNADANSIGSVLNTVFNISAFKEFNLHWFAPIIFFVFALVLHIVSDSKSKNKTGYLILIISMILLADSLLAYFIEYNSHIVYELNGMADDNWVFYKSPRFYLVLFLGFFTCLGWSLILHGIKIEYLKTDLEGQAKIKIDQINKEIFLIQTDIQNQQNTCIQNEGELKTLKDKIQNKKERLNTIVYTLMALEKRITAFCDGWLTYVSHLDETTQAISIEAIENFNKEHKLHIETLKAA
jgi:cell division septum initiation protein DivIVA